MKKIKFFLAAFAAMFGLGAQAQTWTGNPVAEGSFYLYNVGQSKWISSGNSWGTQASLLDAGGFYVVMEADTDNTGKYALKITETQTNKKANGPGYLGANGFMDGESATYFSIEQATRLDGVTAYYIKNGDKNLAYSGSGTTVVFNTETGDNAQWVLVTKDDRLAAMASADEDHPVDATFLLQNPEFGRYKLPAYDAAWTWTFPNGTNKNNAGDNTNFCVECYGKPFDFSQTNANVPNGYYAVRGQAFYRQDGSNNSDLPYFYLGDSSVKVTFPVRSGSENSMTDASNSFSAGTYLTEWSTKYTCSNKTLKVGAHLDNNTALWCIWDNIQIQYYGPLDLSTYVTELNAAVAAAEAYEDQLPAAVYTNIASAITANNKTYDNEEDYTTAIQAINNAVNTYATDAIIADYARYNSIKAAALAISDDVDTAAADTEVEAATTTAAIDAAIVTLRSAFTTYLAGAGITDSQVDITATLIDNAAPYTNGDYWTLSKTPTYDSGNQCAEYWNVGGASIHQTIEVELPMGYYKLTGKAFTRTNMTATLEAGDASMNIVTIGSSEVNGRGAAKTYFDNGTFDNELSFQLESASSGLVIGLTADNTTGDHWMVWRSFKLEYLGTNPVSQYSSAYAKALADAKAVRDNAEYVNVTGTERTALQNAIDASPSTVAEYQAAIEALNTTSAALIAAAPAYNAYVTYRAETVTLFGETLAATVAAPTTAAEATDAVHNLNIAQYNKVHNDYTYSLNGLIGDFGSWTGTATVAGEAKTPNFLDVEHWSGTQHAYYEQAAEGWNSNSGWTIQYQKTCTLPAGDYVLKVAARSSANTTSSISCTATATVISLPNVGGTPNRGINTNGEASWSDDDTFANGNRTNTSPSVGGKGTGWQWRFLPFTLSEQGEVTMTFYAEASSVHQWMSIADGELLSANDVAQSVAYADDESNTINDVLVANVTISRNIKEGFNTVCLPFELTANQVTKAFGTGSEVYAYSEASDDANSATINFNRNDGSISANTPVLVKATAASTEQVFNGVQIVAPTGEAKVAGTNFDFVGTYAPTTVAEGDYFIGNGALYKSTGSTSMNAFRAYIHAKTGASVRLFIDDVETGIEAINGVEAEDGAIYNIAGQRLGKMQKGINIVNGKKIIK